MDTRAKREAAVEDLRGFGGVVVAFSGGAERLVGQGGDHRGVDAPREGDDDPVEATQVLDRGLALCARVHAGSR